jgi:hypothetical protein
MLLDSGEPLLHLTIISIPSSQLTDAVGLSDLDPQGNMAVFYFKIA